MAAMDAEADPSSSLASSSRPTPPAYRIFLGDTEGALKLFHAQCASLPDSFQPPLPELLKISGDDTDKKRRAAGDGAVPGPERAVQKMASGHLQGVGWVIAIARKDATIDVVLPPAADAPREVPASPQQALLLVSITHDKMKPGLQRWVGLAVGPEGIYACTSAGNFIYASLSSDATSSSTRPKLQVSHVQRLELPEPLQSLVFHPASDPTHFLYGGEEIPLSLWHLQTALSPESRGNDGEEDDANGEGDHAAPNGEEKHSNGSNGTMNAKMRKRKRQAEARAKAKELMWGEVWRAKNLPNDSLSLPQRPNILSISILPSANPAASSNEISTPPPLTIVAGTRDGLVRIYEPASGVRKHTKEVRVVLPGQGALKLVTCSGTNEDEVVAADSAGKLYAVDVSDSGRVKYQWKDITGAITSAAPLPPPEYASGRSSESPLLFTTSFDRLLRLHTLPTSPSELVKGSHARGKNLYSAFTGGAGVVASVWDGVVPRVSAEDEAAAEGDGDESMRSRRNGGAHRGQGSDTEGSEGEGDEEEVWQAMQEVGQEDGKRRSGRIRDARKNSSGGEAVLNGAGEEGGEDDEAVKEAKSKRGKKGE
ncbi:hypothetical protein BCV69DRAFT_281646 [Microstroma glucosiphilum]|uniref:Ribosome biogenesis protein NSA1 n=1 Tax=Pseudomicrostroma glucosiphilum TaxID=1684307 RepID=A0A316U8X5_9BASI|nr:hypothetical protein BCV69DRAFT_281646 [Pseudomicrostroma glucosiphilum]PWN21710.1 hypothetical protein BCV69DRAFT_281646 [Pseudomicrostroma glucosiphilum]